jgi:gas vesicle protein
MASRTDKDREEARAESASRGRAAEAYQAARERTASAYEAARSRAGDVTRQATDQLSIYPVGAVIGGFAIGALLAFALPRTEREEQVLGKAGRRLTGAAKDAAQRGLDAGKDQIEQIRTKAAQKVGAAVGDAVADVVAGKQ